MDHTSITELAGAVLRECSMIDQVCTEKGIEPPTLEAGTSGDVWSETLHEIYTARTKALGLLGRLTALLQGPHDFLHDFVASNRDQGALYAFLQSRVLEQISSSSTDTASLSDLSHGSGVPKDKLVRILALLRCKSIIDEPAEGFFAMNAVSEELINDEDFRLWVEFHVHLAEAFADEPNEYENGTSGFKQGWGLEMYDWHIRHPDKGHRFRQAMKGVSKSLDPADSLVREWFQDRIPSDRYKVVEFGSKYGFASISLVRELLESSFEVRCDSQGLVRTGEGLVNVASKARIAFTYVPSLFGPLPSSDLDNVSVYIIRNLLWNWADGEAIKLLQLLVPTLRSSPSARILVIDGVSPSTKDFPPHIEVAYRRRDVTTMTMHNAKQRMQDEWLAMFAQIDPAIRASIPFASGKGNR
ncbi:MAG: hypothetical protein Q9222_004771 [Ikaeria aurantiellina]